MHKGIKKIVLLRKIITPKKNHILIPEEELSFISLFIYFCVMNEIKLHIYSADILADGVTILDPYKESFLAFIL